MFLSRPPPQSRPWRRGDWGLSPQLPLQRVSLLNVVRACVCKLDGHRPQQMDRYHPSTDIVGYGRTWARWALNETAITIFVARHLKTFYP